MKFTIDPGDTLEAISKQTGFTIYEIMKVNPQITDPDKIMAGDTITMPDNPPEGFTGNVKSWWNAYVAFIQKFTG